MIEDIFDEIERSMRRMRRMFEELERFTFSTPIEPRIRGYEFGFKMPLADLREDDENYYVEVEIPGVNKEDIHIYATENSVEIKAEIKVAKEEKREGYIRRERGYTGFYRRFNFSEEIEPDKIKATYKDGILKLVIPKKEKEKKKKVEVNVE